MHSSASPPVGGSQEPSLKVTTTTPIVCSEPSLSRKRSRCVTESPLGRLLEQIKRLKLPFLERDTANKVLAPFIREALQLDDGGTLLSIVQQFGWDGTGFSGAVDLFSLSTALQKYRYERLQELGSGSYAVVYKARNRETQEVIALKKLRFGFDDQGLPSSTLREISLLKELKHDNIVELKDVIYGFGSSNVYVVLECLDCDLRELLDRRPEPPSIQEIKSYMYQIIKAIRYAHMNCVMHRDLKPQNILVELRSGRVKVADFGLARSYLPPCKAYTDKVVTLWYRAPELLLGSRTYSALIDMWSVGCIMAELLNGDPLFRAESEIGLLHKIFQTLGTPSETCWAGVGQMAHFRTSFPQWRAQPWWQLVPALSGDAAGRDLLAGLLAYDPEQRLTASQALAHPWFNDLSEAVADRAAAAAALRLPRPGRSMLRAAPHLRPRGHTHQARELCQQWQQQHALLQPQHQQQQGMCSQGASQAVAAAAAMAAAGAACRGPRVQAQTLALAPAGAAIQEQHPLGAARVGLQGMAPDATVQPQARLLQPAAGVCL